MLAAGVLSNTLLAVKRLDKRLISHPLLADGTSLLRSMGKKVALSLLATNLRALMKADADLSSSPKLAARSGVGQHTVNNLEKARHDPKLSTIEAIARAFGLEVYQLLVPSDDTAFLQVIRAWQQASPEDRELVLAAAETVARRAASRTSASSSHHS
jgi:transcriptional regulator with XRE-family HTH domain